MAATRGENLTRQLLSFSRTLPLNPTVIDPAEAVQAIRDVLAGSMHVNIEFQIDIPDTIWPVCVDKSELELALVNLAVNARDADARRRPPSDLGGKRAARPGRRAGGRGRRFRRALRRPIPAAASRRIFCRGWSSRSSRPRVRTRAPGSACPRSTASRGARPARSTIDSEVGRGTKVTIYLPRSHAAVAAPSPQDEAQYVALNPQTILVVEDNADVRHVAVSLLEQLGYRTIEAETASAALDVLAAGAGRRTLVFSDVVLPGQTDGLALARIGCRPLSAHSGSADHRLQQGVRRRSGISGAAQALSDFRARPRHPSGAQSVDAGAVGAGGLIGRAWPASAEAAEGILHRDLCGGIPAKRAAE